MTRRQFFSTLFAVAVIAPLTRLGWLKPKYPTFALPVIPCPLVDGAGQTGATILTDGWAASTTVLAPGDVITFAGSNAVHPLTFRDIGMRRQFVVTAEVKSDRRGRAKIPLYPPVNPHGPWQNVTCSPFNNARIGVPGGLFNPKANIAQQYRGVKFPVVEMTVRIAS